MPGLAVSLSWLAAIVVFGEPAGDGAPAGPAAAPGSPAVTPADLFARTYIRELSLAPDGRRALIFTIGGDPSASTRLVVHDLLASPSTRAGATAMSPSSRVEHELPADSWSHVAWDPATDTAAFLRGGPPRTELWLSERGAAPRRLMAPGDSGNIFEIFWTPRERAGELPTRGDPQAAPHGLLALYTANAGPREAVLVRLENSGPQSGFAEFGEELYRFGALTIKEATLSPDGGHLALIGTPTPSYAAEGEPLDLFLLDLSTLELRQLTAGDGNAARPAFSPDSSRLACCWQTACSQLSTQKRDLCLFDVAGGVRHLVTAALPVSIGDGIFGASEAIGFVDSRTLLVSTQYGLGDRVLEISLADDGGEPGLRWCTGGSWTRLCVASLGRRLLALESGPSRPEQVVLADWPSFAARAVETPNAGLAARPLARVSVVKFRGADDLELEGLLLLPPAGRPPFPTIVVLHGGSSGRHTLRFNDNFAQAYAALGYAVFAPNLRGSAGYTVEFNGANAGDFGGRELDDLDAGVDELIRRGMADEGRLFLLGHSYGGYLAEMELVKSRRFKAACAASGVSDWELFFRTSDLGALAVVGFGGTPLEQAEAYRAGSPLQRAAEITTPLLLVHGERDRRVPLSQSELLYAELCRRRIDCDLLRLSAQGHVLRGTDVVLRWIGAVDDWFQLHGASLPERGNPVPAAAASAR